MTTLTRPLSTHTGGFISALHDGETLLGNTLKNDEVVRKNIFLSHKILFVFFFFWTFQSVPAV